MASKGLAKAKEIYAKRDSRVRELKAEGKKIMKSYPPLEMITAIDYVPWAARKNPVTKADTQVPTMICPMLRSMLDWGMKGSRFYRWVHQRSYLRLRR